MSYEPATMPLNHNLNINAAQWKSMYEYEKQYRIYVETRVSDHTFQLFLKLFILMIYLFLVLLQLHSVEFELKRQTEILSMLEDHFTKMANQYSH